MFAGSLLIGFAVLLVALWLEYQDAVIWSDRTAGGRRSDIEEEPGKLKRRENRYQKLRRRWRLVIHTLLAVCGGLMIAAGWAGPGPFWIASWTAVAILMLCIVVLAMGDAVRTHHHHVRRLSDLRDRSGRESAAAPPGQRQ